MRYTMLTLMLLVILVSGCSSKKPTHQLTGLTFSIHVDNQAEEQRAYVPMKTVILQEMRQHGVALVPRGTGSSLVFMINRSSDPNSNPGYIGVHIDLRDRNDATILSGDYAETSALRSYLKNVVAMLEEEQKALSTK